MARFSVHRRMALAIGLLLWSSACRREPLPDHFGIFAVTNGHVMEIQPIQGDAARSISLGANFEAVVFGDCLVASKDVYFIIYGGWKEPRLASAVLVADRSAMGIPNLLRPQWENAIRLLASPIEGKDGMLRLRPAEPLANGTYILSVKGFARTPGTSAATFRSLCIRDREPRGSDGAIPEG